VPRKGSRAEYEAKKHFEKLFGKRCVLKTAGSQNVPDLIITNNGAGGIFGIEVKQRRTKPFKPREHDIKQLSKLKSWAEDNDCRLYYYVKFGTKRSVEWVTYRVKEFEKIIKAEP